MIRRLPLIPTLVVAAAAAIMVALGIWQLGRAGWKDRLLAQYAAAAKLPPIAYPAGALAGDPPLYRWATGNCLRPVTKRVTAGRNRAGETGYAHIVHCATGAEGPGMAVELGWSRDPKAQWQWPGGPVSGMIAPDREHIVRLVAASAPAGLMPSALPSADSLSNNHRLYAVQWFLFAGLAVLIYALALRKRLRAQPPAA